MTEDQLERHFETQKEILENGWLTGKYDDKQYDRMLRDLNGKETRQRKKYGI